MKLVIDSGIEASDLIALIEHIHPVSFWRLVSNSLSLNTRRNTRELVRKHIAGDVTVSTPPKEMWMLHFNAPILYVVIGITAPSLQGSIDIWLSQETRTTGKIKNDQLFIRGYVQCCISFYTMDARTGFLLQEPVTAAHRRGNGAKDTYLKALNLMGVAKGVKSAHHLTASLADKNEELVKSVIKCACRHGVMLALGFDNLDQNNGFGGSHVMAFAVFFLHTPTTDTPISFEQVRFRDLEKKDILVCTELESKALSKRLDQQIMNAVVAQNDVRKTQLINQASNTDRMKSRSRNQVGRPKNYGAEEYQLQMSSLNSSNMSKEMRAVRNELPTLVKEMSGGPIVIIQQSFTPRLRTWSTPRDADILSVWKGEEVVLIRQFIDWKVAVIERVDGKIGYVPLSTISGMPSDVPKNPLVSTPLLQQAVKQHNVFDRMSVFLDIERKKDAAEKEFNNVLSRSLMTQFESVAECDAPPTHTPPPPNIDHPPRVNNHSLSKFVDEIHDIVTRTGGGYPIKNPTSYILLPLVDARAGDTLQAREAIKRQEALIEMAHREARDEDPSTPDLGLMEDSDNQETRQVYKFQEKRRISIVSEMNPIRRYVKRSLNQAVTPELALLRNQALEKLSELELKYEDISNEYPQCMGPLHVGFVSVRSFYTLHGQLCMRGIVSYVGYDGFYDKIEGCSSGWYKTALMLIEKSSNAWMYTIVKALNAVLDRTLTPQQINILLPHIKLLSTTGINHCLVYHSRFLLFYIYVDVTSFNFIPM